MKNYLIGNPLKYLYNDSLWIVGLIAFLKSPLRFSVFLIIYTFSFSYITLVYF